MEKRDYCANFEKKSDSSFVNNYRRISLLNNFSKGCEFLIDSHMSRYFTSKLNPSQHDFVKNKINYN
jgi:hypothetical protein